MITVGQIDIYAQEILYNSIMEWVLRKVPSNLNQAIMIDDTDKINSVLAINVLFLLFSIVKLSYFANNCENLVLNSDSNCKDSSYI